MQSASHRIRGQFISNNRNAFSTLTMRPLDEQDVIGMQNLAEC